MRCEELEAIVFSGREITAEERAEMEAHAETCEACRALMDNADALRGMQRIDEDVTPPVAFSRGWRLAIRQTPRVISISDWMRRKGVRVVGYAACAARVFAAGTGVGRLGGNEKNAARTAYDYDYGASDTYEAYPQEDAVALYENSAPALGARSAAEKGAANDSTAEDEKKIVRNAWLTLKTERFDEAVSALCGQIEQAGGVVESRDISGAKNASRSASLTLRVPSDMLDGVLSGASEWGEVTREQTSAVDMTSTYTDNASRLESARAKKRQLDALYEKAETMEDIITLTDAIFDVQEWLVGQNRRIDNQASMATLYVTINEKSSAVAAKQPLLTRMGEEFVEGMENFGEFVFGAVLGLIYALPWAAVAAVAIALASEKEGAVKEDCEDETIYRAGRACALPAQRNGDGG